MYRYWGFGLHISSEIEFPEFLPAVFDAPDLTVRIGGVPESLTGDNVVHKVNVSISPRAYLQHVLDVAKYYVHEGSEIVIQPAEGADDRSVRLFMLSNAMAAALHQRDMIPLHASAVYVDDGVVIFTGASGAGKSTIVTSLQLKGYRVFSDDVCVLRWAADKQSVEVLPSYPMIKLWADSFEKVGLGEANPEDKIRPQLAKFSRFYHDGYETMPMKVKRVFILDKREKNARVSLDKMEAIPSFNALQRNTYRHVQMNAMNKRNVHFGLVSRLAAEAPVYRLSRADDANTIDEVIATIQENLAGQ